MLLPDLTRKKSRVRRFFFWFSIVALIALIFSAKPLYRVFKKHRATALAQEGQLLLSQRKGDAALAKLQAALEMDRNCSQANYGMAQLLTAARHAEAFSYWDSVFSGGGGNANDHIDAAKLAMYFNRTESVGKYLDPVLQQASVPPEALRIAAFFCDQRNIPLEAIRFARAYLQTNPNDAQVSLLLAHHLMSSKNPEDASQAKPLLWKTLRVGGEIGAQAFQLLTTLPDLSTNEIQELLSVLDKQPPGESVRLLKLDLQARLAPGGKDDLIAKALADAKNSPEKFISVCTWLNQKAEYETVLKILSLDQALQSRELFQIYTDAMAGKGKWGDLDAVFNRTLLPIEPIREEVYRARIALELKNAEAAQMHWQTAITAAGQNVTALQYIGGYAERIGALESAAQAYQQMAKDPASARAGYEGLIRLGEKKGDTAHLRDLLQSLADAYPSDPAPQNDLAYLNLLLNKSVDSSRLVAQNLLRDNPKLLAYHTTLALACLRMGDAAAAHKAYDGIKFSWGDVLPGWQAVYVATEGANGSNDLARQFARTIPLDRLKPEEKQLIQQWLQ